MDPFYYEIVHTAAGTTQAVGVRALLTSDPLLQETLQLWSSSAVPPAATLYVLIVIVTDDLANNADLTRRINDIAERRAPVIPIVASCGAYDFSRAPLPVITQRNALGLDTPLEIVDSLVHHGGLRRYGTGGQVMISYARSDGSPLAGLLGRQLQEAGFHAFLDVHEISGGADVQPQIKAQIERSDLVLLVDTKGSARSQWVANEMDMARAAHVPVIAITPEAAGFHHDFRVPHVAWELSTDPNIVAHTAINACRRLLARKETFRDRVYRVLDRLCQLRGWPCDEATPDWLIRSGADRLRVASSAETPQGEAVISLCDLVGESGRGLLVGGTRPYPAPTVRMFAKLGGECVRVTPLPRVASRVFDNIAPTALAGQRIFLSAAMPDEDQRDVAAASLPPFLVTFVQTMFELGATVVFGGHPSVTPLIHKAINEFAIEGSGAVELHQAKYFLRRSELPKEVKDRRVFREVVWHGSGEDLVNDLAALRAGMINSGINAAVFVGGKVKSTRGDPRPGVVDEYEQFRAACPDGPAFILGLGEGAACTLLGHGQPSDGLVNQIIAQELAQTRDPDLATALIVAELLNT